MAEVNFDTRIALEVDQLNTDEQQQNELLLRQESIQREFLGYFYDKTKSHLDLTQKPALISSGRKPHK